MLNASVWLCPLIYPSLAVSGGLSLLCRGSLPPMEGGLIPGVQTALVVVTEGPGAGVSPEGVNPGACLGCPAAGCFASGCGKSFYALAGFQGQRLEDDSRSPAASHRRGAANLLCWRAQGDGSPKMQTPGGSPGCKQGAVPGGLGCSIPSTPLPVVRRARGAADPTPPDASPRRAVLGTVPGGKRGTEAQGRLEGRPGPGHSVPRGRQACPCPGDTASGVIYGEVPAGFEHGLSPSCSQNEARVLGSGRARGRTGRGEGPSCCCLPKCWKWDE